MQLNPIFTTIPSNSTTTPANNNKANTAQHIAVDQQVAPPKVIPGRSKESMGTPSIKDALRGNIKKEEATKNIIPEHYTSDNKAIDKQFALDELMLVWEKYAKRYEEEVHLFHTLTSQPINCQGSEVTITIENSVQYDQVRVLKPEITGFLRRELENSKIEIIIKQEKVQNNNRAFTDDQKLQGMIQKNPELGRLKMLFHLDFNL